MFFVKGGQIVLGQLSWHKDLGLKRYPDHLNTRVSSTRYNLKVIWTGQWPGFTHGLTIKKLDIRLYTTGLAIKNKQAIILALAYYVISDALHVQVYIV